MSNNPIKQHYISCCHLQEFSIKNKNKYLIWVYDYKKKTWRSSTPKSEAIEKNFQTLCDGNGNKSYEVETELAHLESDFAAVVRSIKASKYIPQEGTNLGALLSVMGLFAGRNPYIRNMFTRLRSDFYEKMMVIFAENPKLLKKLSSEISAEELISFKKNYRIKHDEMTTLAEIFKAASTITDLLFQRSWMLVEAPAPLFITSNKPVNPFWLENSSHIDLETLKSHPTLLSCYIPYSEKTNFLPQYLPGFGTPNSIVVFPLTPSLALIGAEMPLPIYKKIDYCTAMAINWVTANSGAEYIYSPQKYDCLPWHSSYIPYLQNIIPSIRNFHKISRFQPPLE